MSLLVAFSATVAQADKVVRLYNPWDSYGPGLIPDIRLVNNYPLTGFGGTGTINVFRQIQGPWLEVTIPDPIPAGSIEFEVILSTTGKPYYQSWGTKGIGGGAMDLGALFPTHDTLWLVPGPLPDGPALVLTAPPKEMTVMLWNPFEFDAESQVPSLRVDGGGWGAMDTVKGDPGWYARYFLGYQSLSLLFRNADSSKFLGTAGVGVPIPAVFDSLDGRNDTVWVWASPEPNGVPQASVVRPNMKTIMFYNPWDGIIPFQKPRIKFDGADMPMRPDPAYCGWSGFRFISRIPTVTFSNSVTGESFGADGLGSTRAIDLASTFAIKDTVWITSSPASGLPVVRSTYTGERGLCEITLLAATVHDFDSSHPNFEEGAGGSCGLVKGMVAPTLGPDRKPQFGPNRCRENGTRIVDQYLTTHWFHSVDSVNSTTCRDIPLALDSVNGNYRYDNTSYFPIDDFQTRDDGTPNPHYVLFNGGSDNKPHNFHYCLESHGEFDFKKGQRFSFRGDDDVWFFIDNRLAVDLGGVHNPESASVLLDTMGLVEGRTYNFDFFYCERQTVGANMRIETSMNLRTPSGFKVLDTLRAPGVVSFDLFVSQRLGQGCSTNDNVQRTAGRFLLSGPPFDPPTSLGAGLSYGGINILADMSKLVFDSTAITGLPPGRYVLRVLPATGDTSSAKEVVFVVPLNAQPFYKAKTPYSGLVGTSFPVEVESRRADGTPDKDPVAFVIHPLVGLRYFRDSAGLSEILPGDTLMTGANSVSRQLWVRGVAVGDYVLPVGFGPTDTVDLYPGISFRQRLLRWVDAAGNPISPIPPMVKDVRTSQQVWVEAVSGDSRCLTCQDTLLLEGSLGLEFLDAGTAGPLGTLRLVDGRATFLVHGPVPSENGSLRATTKDGSASVLWSPIAFRAPRLQIEDTTGAPLEQFDLVLGESRPLVVHVLAGVDTCVGCDVPIALELDDPLLGSLLPEGTVIDSAILVGGKVLIWVRATAPSVGADLVVRSDSLWARDTVKVRVLPPVLRFVDSTGRDLPGIEGEVLVDQPFWIEVRGGNGICVSCNGTVDLSSLDPEILVRSSGGGPVVASLPLVSGRSRGWVEGRSTTPAGASLVAQVATLWAGDTLALRFTARPPDSAFWFDADGDGSADSLLVHLAHPWRSVSRLDASWPDGASMVRMSSDPTWISADSMVVAWRLAAGLAPLTTRGEGASGSLGWDGRGILTFPVADRIAPVPIKAVLVFGQGYDTLRMPWSEPVAAGFAQGAEMVMQHSDGNWRPASPALVLRDTLRGELVLLYAAGDLSEPQPGDSLRFSPSGSLKDALGNAPGENARRVLLQGTDRIPYAAVMRDSDGDGRADQVVLRFRSPLRVTSRIGFKWPGSSGLVGRAAPPSAAASDSGGRILTFNLDPWEYGFTSCPDAGCADLGVLVSVWGEDTSRALFPILDEVPPVPVKAVLRYGPGANGPDTFTVVLSEPIQGGADLGSAWFSSGRPSQGDDGTLARWIGLPEGSTILSADGKTAVFLVDTTFAAAKGDSLRITSKAAGGTVVDRNGNASPAKGAWIPIEFGPHPLILDWRPMPNVRNYEGWKPPPQESSLQILVPGPSGGWVDLQGRKPAQDTSHYGGIYLKFNRAMRGWAFVYDNLGIFVAGIDLEPIALAIEKASIEPNRRGDFEVWVAWNGTSAAQSLSGAELVVPSGVYIFRVITHYKENDEQVFLNQVFKTGWKH